MAIRIFLCLCIMVMTLPANAITLEEPLENPQQEARARELFHEVRCVVCAGESIADSRAKIATDLRFYIREKIAQGLSDEQIIDHLRIAYGTEILMRPPIQENTLILWLAPFLILIGGGFAVWRFAKK